MPTIILEAADTAALDAFLRDCPDAAKYGVTIKDADVLVYQDQDAVRGAGNKQIFVWNDGENSHLILAADETEAFRRLFSVRLAAAGEKTEAIVTGKVSEESVLNSLRWHQKNDTLEQITSFVDEPPYTGTVPEIDGAEDEEEYDEDDGRKHW